MSSPKVWESVHVRDDPPRIISIRRTSNKDQQLLVWTPFGRLDPCVDHSHDLNLLDGATEVSRSLGLILTNATHSEVCRFIRLQSDRRDVATGEYDADRLTLSKEAQAEKVSPCRREARQESRLSGRRKGRNLEGESGQRGQQKHGKSSARLVHRHSVLGGVLPGGQCYIRVKRACQARLGLSRSEERTSRT